MRAGVCSETCSDIPKSDLGEVSNVIFVRFTQWRMVSSKETYRFPVVLKNEVFNDKDVCVK